MDREKLSSHWWECQYNYSRKQYGGSFKTRNRGKAKMIDQWKATLTSNTEKCQEKAKEGLRGFIEKNSHYKTEKNRPCGVANRERKRRHYCMTCGWQLFLHLRCCLPFMKHDLIRVSWEEAAAVPLPKW